MKQYINGDTLANDARMRRSIFKGAFLFLEGESDERFFGVFTDIKNCQIIVCHGREKLLEACDILTTGQFDGFLGIRDADFTHCDSSSAIPANIFVTDFHDVECFLLRGSAFDRVLSEFARKDKLENWCRVYTADVRAHLLMHSVEVGYLLWHSLRSRLALHFDNLEMKEFADRDSLVVDVAKLVEHTKHKSQRHDLDSNGLIGAMTALKAGGVDHWQIVRGHDYVELLSLALRRSWGNWQAPDVSPERIEQSLRLAYPSEEFAATRLFQLIKQWEVDHSPYVILRVIGTQALFST